MSPAERRAADRSKEQQDLEAKKAAAQAKKSEREESEQERLSAAKLKQREKEFEARERDREQINKRMERTLDLKQKESDRKDSEAKERAANRQAETERKNKKAKDKVEKDKERENKRQLMKDVKRRSALTSKDVNRLRSIKVGFDDVNPRDGTATAVSKFGANIGTAAGAAVKAGALGARAAYRKVREIRAKNRAGLYDKKKKFVKGLFKRKPKDAPDTKGSSEPIQKIKTDQNVPAQKALPPARSPERKALPAARSTAAPQRKALPPGRSTASSQKALPAARSTATPERKALPAAKPASERKALPPKTVDQANNERAAKRAQTTSSGDYASKADRIAAFKKRRAADQAAGVKMREEFLQEVEKMKKEKVNKLINIMRGKNKIETMPKTMGESWRDDYKPLEFETVDLIKPEPLKASNWRKEIDESSAAWTRKAGKNKSGGLNEKGRKSYERENPGSDLKAPSKKVGNPRRKSFCARMKGMKKKLTSSKTANDPDSRINKSLRAWNC